MDRLMPNNSFAKDLNGWLRVAVLVVMVIVSFVAVREGVSSNKQAIGVLQESKANKEVVAAQYNAIMNQLTLIQNQIIQLQQNLSVRP